MTNNSGAAINNLTLVALEQTGNLAGAIKTASSFNGASVNAATAALARPTHGMTTSGVNVVVNTSNNEFASFQAITPTEASSIQADANFAAQGLSGTVLEYGFVATNGNSRTIPNAGTGNVTFAYRFPTPLSAAGAYSFVATFVVTSEAAVRVSRSPEESTASADARATALGATEKYLIDDPAVNTTAGYTVVNNLKTGATTNLLKNPAKMVISRVYSTGGLAASSTYRNDFVELFNAGEWSVKVNPSSVQYGGVGNNTSSNLGNGGGSIASTSTFVLAPGQYALIGAGNSGSGSTTPAVLPTTNATMTVNINSTDGKVALITQTAALGCGGLATCSAAQNAAIADLFGFGLNGSTTRNKFLGTIFSTSATAPTSTQAMTRLNKGCANTSNNAADFSFDTLNTTSNPARNTASPTFICP